MQYKHLTAIVYCCMLHHFEILNQKQNRDTDMTETTIAFGVTYT